MILPLPRVRSAIGMKCQLGCKTIQPYGMDTADQRLATKSVGLHWDSCTTRVVCGLLAVGSAISCLSYNDMMVLFVDACPPEFPLIFGSSSEHLDALAWSTCVHCGSSRHLLQDLRRAGYRSLDRRCRLLRLFGRSHHVSWHVRPLPHLLLPFRASLFSVESLRLCRDCVSYCWILLPRHLLWILLLQGLADHLHHPDHSLWSSHCRGSGQARVQDTSVPLGSIEHVPGNGLVGDLPYHPWPRTLWGKPLDQDNESGCRTRNEEEASQTDTQHIICDHIAQPCTESHCAQLHDCHGSVLCHWSIAVRKPYA